MIAYKFVLKPIFSPTAIASSVVPVLEHSCLNSKNFLSLRKNFEISWSTETAKNEKPKSVSGLVVKHFILFTGKSPSILNSISQPKDLPISFLHYFTLFGQLSSVSNPSKSSWKLDMLKTTDLIFFLL